MRALAIAVACACAAAPAHAQTRSAAEIVSLEGQGEYHGEAETAWHSAHVKQPLAAGDFVRTLDLSRMAILYADRTQIQVSPNSMVQVKQVSTGPATPTVIDLKRGRAWTQSKTTPGGLIMQTPSAIAAIRGTDWQLEVDDQGRATISVFSGVVDFYNDQGRVEVGRDEQATAEIGRAPVKLQLRTSRDRIQWVSSMRIDPARHPGETLAQAAARIRRSNAPAAGDQLLLGDIALYEGDVPKAQALFDEGLRRFPGDARFEVALARAALFAGDYGLARSHAMAALRIQPENPDALVALGDIERRDGRAEASLAAYQRAIQLAPADPRAWVGAGAVEGERENVRRARTDLLAAIERDRSDAEAWGELGSVEGFANNLAQAREALARALEIQPDSYVALTGLGVAELKAGHVDAAIDALVRASLIEPRYARAHLYLAAAYYQAEREKPALEELRRASETDPNDPLPHILASIIHLDHLDPVAAWEEASQAQARIPYLKSLNTVADNQKGVANVGYPLAFMGLESWARSAAHDSYLPFWGASHFFLADRYPGDFDKRSELMQGFITDPLAFGASNRFQTLVAQPGHHGTAQFHYAQSDDVRLMEGVATLNGLDVSRVPFTYYAEVIDSRVDPRNTAVSLHGPTYTLALGAKPTNELSLFLYTTRLDLDADLGAPNVTGVTDHVEGTAYRVDAGARYAFDAQSSLWLKGGAERSKSRVHELAQLIEPSLTIVQGLDFGTQPTAQDASARYTTVRGAFELTAGAEGGRNKEPRQLVRDASSHLEGTPVPTESVDQVDHGTSGSLYGALRWDSPTVRIEAGAAWDRYALDRDILVQRTGGTVPVQESYDRRRFDPWAGITWRPVPSARLRAACRRWLHGATLDTLAPVAVAAMPLQDQLVFPGGELDQCRGQAQWIAGERRFLTVSFERDRVRNLVSPLDGVLNTQTDVTNIDRLRNRALTPPPKPDQLEDTPVFGEGVARLGSIALEQVLGRRTALRVGYTYADTYNTAPAFAGAKIPYIARHQGDIGLTFAPGWHTYVTLEAIYRTRRFTDEANTVQLPSGWDTQAIVYVETPDKHWSVEVHGSSLFKKEASDVFGVLVSYRF